MREIYSVEYRGDRAQVEFRPEDLELRKERALELAHRWCLQYPNRVAVIYREVEKPNGLDFKGRRKFAAQTVTERIIKGRAYSGPRVFSTMMRRGRIGNLPDTEVAPA